LAHASRAGRIVACFSGGLACLCLCFARLCFARLCFGGFMLHALSLHPRAAFRIIETLDRLQ
jgi:hypothetical protein